MNRQKGVMVTENPSSPWYQTTYLKQAFTVIDSDGKVFHEAALCENTDADGDMIWSILWCPIDGQGTFEFIHGTGKWEGINGKGQLKEDLESRVDDHVMLRWHISWVIDTSKTFVDDSFSVGSEYTGFDEGYSFHGPHVTKETKTFANGLIIDANTQAGVMITQNPESPLYHATWKSQDTSVKDSTGRTLGDVLLLEEMDPDGNIAWSYQVWWYNSGEGSYRMIGGIGKWKGIEGERKVRGMVRNRTDDHFMLKEEIRWKID